MRQEGGVASLDDVMSVAKLLKKAGVLGGEQDSGELADYARTTANDMFE